MINPYSCWGWLISIPEAPGILYAYRHNLFVTVNFIDLLQLPELDILVNATGLPEVSQELQAHCPEGVSVLSCDRPHSGEDFWDIISNSQCLSFTEEYFPLKIGIVGGGKGCQKVLQQTARGLRNRQRINIIGVADPDPRAPGMVVAKELGIPTFGEYGSLLEEAPDLILELTGDPQVRESIDPTETGPHRDYRPYPVPAVLGVVQKRGRPAAP